MILFMAAIEGSMKPRPDFVFDVHGSITFSDGTDYPIPTDPQLWWYGFDCARADDTPDEWTLERTWQETLRLAAQLNMANWPKENDHE